MFPAYGYLKIAVPDSKEHVIEFDFDKNILTCMKEGQVSPEEFNLSEDLMLLLFFDRTADSLSSMNTYKKIIKKCMGKELLEFLSKRGVKTTEEREMYELFMGNLKYTSYILNWIRESKTGRGLESYRELSTQPIILPNNPNDQLKRVFILLGSLKAGNNDSSILKELSAILDTLLKEEIISKQLYKPLFYKAKRLLEDNSKK